MRVALFYVNNVLGGWGSAGGYAAALRRSGHEVVEYAFPQNQVMRPEEHVRRAPTLERLNSCDVILVMGYEYTHTWLANVYSYDEVWKKVKTPIVGRLDESVDRFDLFIERRMDDLRRWCSTLAFPAAQDAEKYQAPLVPHCVDTEAFKPPADDEQKDKRYQVAFIGSLYPQRATYLRYLAEHISKGLDTIHCGQVLAQDLAGTRADHTAQMLAENYRQIKVFFCLPPLSRLVVTKAFEVMACGTFLMYPRFPGEAGKNEQLFKDGVDLAYYDIGQFIDNGRQIVDWLYDDAQREQVAAVGCERVRADYSYERMFEMLFRAAGIEADKAVGA